MQPPSPSIRAIQCPRRLAPFLLALMVSVGVWGMGCPIRFEYDGVDAGHPREESGVDGGVVDAGENGDGGLVHDGGEPVDGGDDAGPVVDDGGLSPDAGATLDICGDALLGAQEECDDGNQESGDGCDATCAFELNCRRGTPLAGVTVEAIGTLTSLSGSVDAVATTGAVFAAPGAGSQSLPWTFAYSLPQPSKLAGFTWGLPVEGRGGVRRYSVKFFGGGGELRRHAGPFVPRTDTGTAEQVAVPTVFDVARVEFVIEEVDSDESVALRDIALVGVSSCCGDGQWSPREACEDANVTDGDGCSAQCEVEDGFTCDDATKTNRIVNGGFAGGLAGFSVAPAYAFAVTDAVTPEDCSQGRVAVSRVLPDYSDDGFALTGWGALNPAEPIWSTDVDLGPGTYTFTAVFEDRSRTDNQRPSFDLLQDGVVVHTFTASDAGQLSPPQSIDVVVESVGDAAPTEQLRVVRFALRPTNANCPGNEFYVDAIALRAADGIASRLSYCGGCGDSILADGEECDDGNVDGNDGCSPSCAIEGMNIACPVAGAPCVTIAMPSTPFDTEMVGLAIQADASRSCSVDKVLAGWNFDWGVTPIGGYVGNWSAECLPWRLAPDGTLEVEGEVSTLGPIGPVRANFSTAHQACAAGGVQGVQAILYGPTSRIRGMREVCRRPRVFPAGMMLADEEGSTFAGYPGIVSPVTECPLGSVGVGLRAGEDGAFGYLGLQCRGVVIQAIEP